MTRKSRVVYLYIKKKSDVLRVVFVFCSDGNVGDFCSFKGYGPVPIGRKFKNS